MILFGFIMHSEYFVNKLSNYSRLLNGVWFYNRALNTQASQRIKMRKDGTLEILAVRASDVGDYMCSVVSPGGNETRSARLSVIELPFSPMKVIATRVESISPRTINVTWVPGFDGNSPTKKFIIQRREVPELGECHSNYPSNSNVE